MTTNTDIVSLSAVKQPIVMAVDDEPANLSLISMALKKDFDVHCCGSSTECLNTIDDLKPDIILLDVNMPDRDGYETCQYIRQNQLLQDTPIVFISAQTDLEAKLKGYDAGGDDYITKPVNIIELGTKIKTIIGLRAEQNKKLHEAHSMVSLALNNSGEYGVVISFCTNVVKTSCYQSLAMCLLDELNSFELNCCVKIRGVDEDIFLSTGGGPCCPMEEELLNALIWGQRIKDFGKRATFNFNQISLLVKNMPTHDSDRSGRLRDHIGIMLSTAESQVEIINSKKKERQVINEINSTLTAIHTSLADIKYEFEKKESSAEKIMENLLIEFNFAFSSLNLTLEQEQFFVDQTNKHVKELLDMFDDSKTVDERLNVIADRLQRISSDPTQLFRPVKAGSSPTNYG